MKKFLILTIACGLSFAAYGQKPVLKSGSLISVESKEEVRAKDVNVGDLIALSVAEDVKVGDSIVISKGNKAFAKVSKPRSRALQAQKEN